MIEDRRSGGTFYPLLKDFSAELNEHVITDLIMSVNSNNNNRYLSIPITYTCPSSCHRPFLSPWI